MLDPAPMIAARAGRRARGACIVSAAAVVAVLVAAGCAQTPRDRYYQARSASFAPDGSPPAAVAAASAE